jgi:replicative DNA helicase
MTDHDEPLFDEPIPDDLGGMDLDVPHDEHAEQATLGAMMLGPSAVNDAETLLGEDGTAFYKPAHQTIYLAILAIHGKPGVRADPITVAASLRAAGMLDKVGGAAYLHHLVNQVPTAANGAWYAGIVRDTYRLRRIVEFATRARNNARLAEADPDAITEALVAECQALLADATGTPEERLSVAENWEPFIDELNTGADPTALDSPWHDLNEVAQFKPKELTVVGAATAGGKSLFGMNLAAHIALRRGRPVLVASMEMSRKELLARLTAAEASIELDRLIRRRLTDDDWQRIARVSDLLGQADKFILDDSPALSVAKIRARVRWMAAQGTPPALVVVDYMQLITPESTRGGEFSRAQEIARISRGLKLLAAEHDVPVVALAQFNRSAVGRKPLVTDFKDSSQIEQDASLILLLHRELAEDGTDTGPRAGEVDLIVGKNRNGQQGREIALLFQGRYGRLRSMAKSTWTPTAAAGGVS